MDAMALRELRIGEILDVAIRIYRERFTTLVRAALVVTIPVWVLNVIVGLSVSDSDDWVVESTQPGVQPEIDGGKLATFLVGLFVGLVLSFLATQIASAACIRAVSGAYLGENPTWRETLSFAFSRLGSLVWLALLAGVVMLLGFLTCGIPGIYLYCAYSVAPVVLLLENRKGWKALERSRHLIAGRWWHTAAVLLIMAVLGGIVGGVIGLVLSGFASGDGNTLSAILADGVTQLVASAIMTPLSAAVIAVIYFDLRVRKEGFDLELLAQRVGVAPPPISSIPPPPPPPPALGKADDAPPPPPAWPPPTSS